MLAGTPGASVGDCPSDLGRPARVEAARLGVQPAVAGNYVARSAAFDQADVGGGALVEPAQLHPVDRGGRGGDRAAALLGLDPGVGLDPGEVGANLLLGRGGDDHLADRPGVVEHEPDLGAQLRGVEGFRPPQPLLLGHGQHQLDPDRRRLRPRRRPGHQLHEDCHRRLVVGAEDGLAAAAENAFVLDHLDQTPMGNGVEVGAEHHPLVALSLQPRQQVAGPGFSRPSGFVLAHL